MKKTVRLATTALCTATLVCCLIAACSDDADKDNKQDGAVPLDKGNTTPDKGKPDSTWSGPNSGALCNKSKPCKHPKDVCLYGGKSTTWGMCLMHCTPGTSCPKPQYGPYASECAFSYNDKGNPKSACGWYCKYQGSDYKCPNDKDYTCWAPTTSEPNTQFCVPK